MGNIILTRDFYARDTKTVARELLGQLIIRKYAHSELIGMIVETEAYYGFDDPPSHASRGITPRSKTMFGEPGHAYIYLNYGVHWLLNFVTEAKGCPGAVLIRAIEPVAGQQQMLKLRHVQRKHELSNGPGKLTKALAIDKALNGHDLLCPPLQVAQGSSQAFKISMATRIGISVAKDKLLRYYIQGNVYVSK